MAPTSSPRRLGVSRFVPSLLSLVALVSPVVAEPQTADLGASAQAVTEAEDLGEISLEDLSNIKVYSVSKREEDTNSAPGIVTVMTAKEMRQLGVRTIEEALRLIPGYQVPFTPRRSSSYARGVPESALVLIDGIPIVSLLDNEIFLDEEVSLDIVDHIEVLRGPGGLLWGATAFAGVINIVTQKATSTDGEARVIGLTGSNTTNKVGLNYNKKGERWSFVGNFTELRTRDFKISSPDYYNPATGYWGDGYSNTKRRMDFFREGMIKVGYENLELLVRLENHHDYYQIDLYGRGAGQGYDMNESDPTKELIRLGYKKSFSGIDVNAKAWRMQRKSYLEGMSSLGKPRSGNVEYVFDTWSSTQNGGEVTVGSNVLSDKNYLLVGGAAIRQYGTDVYTYNQFKDINGGPTGVPIDPYDWYGPGYPTTVGNGSAIVIPELAVKSASGENVWSAYLQDTYKVLDNLSLAAGYRFDHNTSYDPVRHYSFSSVYEFVPDQFLKFMYSEGFRPADWEQKNSTSYGGGELHPEESKAYEFQYNGTIDKTLSYFVNYARTKISDLVVFDDLTEKYTNRDLQASDSVEAGFRKQFDQNAFVFANYSYLRIKTPSNQNVSFLARTVGNIGVTYPLCNQLSGTFTLHSEGPRYMAAFAPGTRSNDRSDPTVERKLNTFAVANAGLLYDFKAFQVSAFIYNLFDGRYESVPTDGIGIVPHQNPRRYGIAQLTYRF
jgi:iron complex outermembrane receptor protein